MTTINEERVVWSEVFYAETFDFRSRLNFCRYDDCTFVRCTLLFDDGTEQIAFSGCTFKDCNIDPLDADEARGIVSRTIRSTNRWKKSVQTLTIVSLRY